MNDEVGLHVLLLHFACLYKISHARGVPATPLPQHCVQRAQQSPDVVLHNTQTVMMHLSEHQLLAVVMNQDMLGMLAQQSPDVVLQKTQIVLMHLSEHQLLAVVMNQDMLGTLGMLAQQSPDVVLHNTPSVLMHLAKH